MLGQHRDRVGQSSRGSWTQRFAGFMLLFLACIAMLNLVLEAQSIGSQSENQAPDAELTNNEAGNLRLIMAAHDETPELTTLPPQPTNPDPDGFRIHYTAKKRSIEAEQKWRLINGPNVGIYYYSDDDNEALVRQYRPAFLETFRTKLSPVERADYFRYLVVWVYGGVYVDSDVEVIAPVDQWLSAFEWDEYEGRSLSLQSLDAVVGVEFPFPQANYIHTGWLPLQFTQFTFAGAKRSPVMERILDSVERCVETIDRGDNVEITLERTGPAVFTRAILDAITDGGVVTPSVAAFHDERKKNNITQPWYPRALLPTNELEKRGQLVTWKRPGDEPLGQILVLPYRAFAYYVDHHLADAPVLTKHLFWNTWRHSD